MNLKFQRITDKYLGIPLCYWLHFFKEAAGRFQKKTPDRPVQKILLIKFWGIGNIIMLFPTIKALREHYPSAVIDFFTLSQNRQALEGNPHINQAFFLRNDRFAAFAWTYLKNAALLRRNDYDLVLDFEQFAKTSSVFALLVGKRERIGFDTPAQGRGIAYSRKVAYLDYPHMVETFFRIAKGAGVDHADLTLLPLEISDADRKAADRFLEGHGVREEDFLVGMHLGSGENMLPRRWEKEKFARLADCLMEKHAAKVVFTGHGEHEVRLVSDAIALMLQKPINAAGKLTLKALAELIRRCRFFVSNDTAPVHIASAMGTPVVGFYGPNTPYLYGPRGENNLVFYRDLYCSPCITNYNAKISHCTDPKCIRDIRVEEVLDAIEKQYLR
ncbi:MAG: glycosyltransferase family 9 protein [Deltaproteobacteria bacterium]|nr:glycosyltransferase family 9 protein [Deltaproteobacteria bacterium]MBW2041947.1 glycosyltransferase family 9 protein [Deltaproteobacteria bacterium]MBW2133349.1 glycosyltransferase family 9 protein [Deltaproteobacteria bacterium]